MSTRRVCALALGALVASAAFAQAPQPATKAAASSTRPAAKSATGEFKLVVEPQAMDLLKAMSARLAAAKAMSFTATVEYEYPSKLGPAIVYATRYDVTMQRPDKLRVVSPGDGPVSEFYYDGKTMTAYAPVENLAAVAAAPPTMEGMLTAAYKTAAIYYPFTDLILPDPYAVLAGGVKLAFVIGPSKVGSVATDMVAWANDDVFVQVWIGSDDKLPRRIRAVFRADPLRLRHEMELANWQLDPAIPPDAFAPAKAQTAGRMEFAAPSLPPKGVKPVALGKASSKAK